LAGASAEVKCAGLTTNCAAAPAARKRPATAGERFFMGAEIEVNEIPRESTAGRQPRA